MKLRNCLICLLVGILLAPAVSPAAEDGTRVAVVNLPLIFQEYDMTADLERKFDSLRQGKQAQAQKKQEEIEAKKAELQRASQTLLPSSEEFKAIQKEVQRMELEFEWWAKQEEEQLKAEHKAWLLKIYKNVAAEVEAVAQEGDIDLVLAHEELAEDAPDSASLRQQILLQKIVYFDDKLDLTRTVLTRLDEKYQAAGGAQSLQLSLDTEPDRDEQKAELARQDDQEEENQPQITLAEADSRS